MEFESPRPAAASPPGSCLEGLRCRVERCSPSARAFNSWPGWRLQGGRRQRLAAAILSVAAGVWWLQGWLPSEDLVQGGGWDGGEPGPDCGHVDGHVVDGQGGHGGGWRPEVGALGTGAAGHRAIVVTDGRSRDVVALGPRQDRRWIGEHAPFGKSTTVLAACRLPAPAGPLAAA